MFQNALLTTITPMYYGNQIGNWNQELGCIGWPSRTQSTSEQKDRIPTNKITRNKKKRNRTMFTTDQLLALENIFSKTKYIDPIRRKELSESLRINDRCIKIWFQNRRMKEKKELRESSSPDAEYRNETSSPLPMEYESKYIPQYFNTNLDQEKLLKDHIMNKIASNEYEAKYAPQKGINNSLYQKNLTPFKDHIMTPLSMQYEFENYPQQIVDNSISYQENLNSIKDNESLSINNGKYSPQQDNINDLYHAKKAAAVDKSFKTEYVANSPKHELNYCNIYEENTIVLNNHAVNTTNYEATYSEVGNNLNYEVLYHPKDINNASLPNENGFTVFSSNSPVFCETSGDDRRYFSYNPQSNGNSQSNHWSETFDLTYL